MLKIANDFGLPIDFITWKAACLGRTGSGKTNTGVVIAEQVIKSGNPVAIIDPQGDWWGLRSKFKIAILGGEHGDIPLDPANGEQAADFVINERVPVLLDLFQMTEGEMVRFGADFAKRLWHKNREALHVFLDEADLFAPQSGAKGPKAVCLGAWQNVLRRGRTRGIGCTMLTQRSAVINKDLLTQADPLFVHRLTAPQDLQAVRDYLEAHGVDNATQRDIIADISKLPLGACWIISPGSLGIEPRRLQINYRASFDSSAAPAPGESRAKPADFAKIDVAALSRSFAAAVEKAAADDPKRLRAKIAELEAKLANQEQRWSVDPEAIAAEVAAAREEERESFRRLIQQGRDHYNASAELIGKALENLAQIEAIPFPTFYGAPEAIYPPGNAQAAQRPAKPPKAAKPAAIAPKPPKAPAVSAAAGGLDKLRRAILTVLAQHPAGLTKQALLIHAGYAAGGKPSAAFADLGDAGYVETPKPGSLKITAAGVAALGPFEPLPVGDALRTKLLGEGSKLSSLERALLKVICAAYPQAIGKQAILGDAGYAAGGKPSAAFAKLRKIGYVTSPAKGELRAADELFTRKRTA